MVITTKNINMQTPAYTITIGEIIDEFKKAKTRKDKKEVLEKHKGVVALQHLLRVLQAQLLHHRPLRVEFVPLYMENNLPILL